MEYLKIGLLWGVVCSLIHAGWAFVVSQAWGQPLIDFLLKIHFLNNPFVVQPFGLPLALLLIGFTGALGLLAGSAFALLRDMFLRSNKQP